MGKFKLEGVSEVVERSLSREEEWIWMVAGKSARGRPKVCTSTVMVARDGKSKCTSATERTGNGAATSSPKTRTRSEPTPPGRLGKRGPTRGRAGFMRGVAVLCALASGGRIVGRVADPKGAAVKETRSDEERRFALEGIGAGEYPLMAESEGLVKFSAVVRIGEGAL